MIASRIRFENWGPFRGVTELDLTTGVYAVVARLGKNRNRSNWLGKTRFLTAFWFALYGEHGMRTEDEWITDGETTGGVTLFMDTGLEVERTRVRGRSTQVRCGDAKGKEAEAAIVRAVGLGEQDFTATCFFRQKSMSRLVVCQPSERMEVVSEWFSLSKLDACADNVSARVEKLNQQAALLETNLRSAQAVMRSVVEEHLKGIEPDNNMDHDAVLKLLDEQRQAWSDKVQEQKGVVGRLENEIDRAQANERLLAEANEYHRLVEQGTRLKGKLAGWDEWKKKLKIRTKKEREAREKSAIARREERQKKSLMRGEFSGKCPVGGVQCPITAELNESAKASRKLHVVAERAANEADDALVAAETKREQAEAKVVEFERISAQCDSLRERARRLKPSADKASSIVPMGKGKKDELAAARSAMVSAHTSHEALVRAIATYKRNKEQSEKVILPALDKLREQLAVHREAALVFGRNGAQKRIASDRLSVIEQGANELLAESGIALGVEVRWGHEGKGLADICDTCGTPFGQSLRIKVCAHCGNVRGPKLVNKFEIRPTRVSGGAEDLAGGAFQLSASAWLRNDRSSAWSVALIDEPFGALDTEHRKALAHQLTVMLQSSYGFRQTFITAHHDTVMDALPKRVEIVSDGTYSTARIV